MRLVVQRVNKAAVRVKDTNEYVGRITKGLLVLVGIGEDDNEKKAELLAEKLVKLRVMGDSEGKMNLSVKDTNAKILAVSQFTLFADTTAGNRPSFIKAANPELAKKVYDHFIDQLKKRKIGVEMGSFGDYMVIEASLDGPVTILYF